MVLIVYYDGITEEEIKRIFKKEEEMKIKMNVKIDKVMMVYVYL